MHLLSALVAELVDALDLGSSDSCRVGSSPIRRTEKQMAKRLRWKRLAIFILLATI